MKFNVSQRFFQVSRQHHSGLKNKGVRTQLVVRFNISWALASNLSAIASAFTTKVPCSIAERTDATFLASTTAPSPALSAPSERARVDTVTATPADWAFLAAVAVAVAAGL